MIFVSFINYFWAFEEDYGAIETTLNKSDISDLCEDLGLKIQPSEKRQLNFL